MTQAPSQRFGRLARRVVSIACLAVFTLGTVACGSSSGKPGTNNAPTATTTASGGATTAPQGGGAGF